MKKILLSAYIVTWVLLLSACGGGSKTSSLQAEGDTVRMKYSSLLQIVKHADYTVVTIRNPWDTLKVLLTCLLTVKNRFRNTCPKEPSYVLPCRSRSSIRLYTAACGLNSTS